VTLGKGSNSLAVGAKAIVAELTVSVRVAAFHEYGVWVIVNAAATTKTRPSTVQSVYVGLQGSVKLRYPSGLAPSARS
jgi:hypothetical protein